MKPWSDVIPTVDVESFKNGFDPSDRPITAGSNPAVIVVDMTKAFVDSAYPTGWSETGYPAVEANKKLITEARQLGVPVYYTKGYPVLGYKPSAQEKGLWKSSGRAWPEDLPPGDFIMPDIEPMEGEIVINKGGKPSGFFGTPLVSYLIKQKIDTVIVTGMTTSGCVRATVLDAFMNNFNVIVPFECAADRSQLSHKVNLFDMHMKYADVVSLEETVSWMWEVVKVPVLA